MAFADLLDHSVFLVRHVQTGEDDYGLPETIEQTGGTFRAAIQPKSAREMADQEAAGLPIGDTRIYLLPRVVNNGDVLIHDTSACPKSDATDLPTGRYEILAVLNQTGRGHHLALDTRLFGDVTGVEGS